ncbi:MAG: hypothetical protein ACREIU_13640 [Planctomycetota bacterium]
MTPAVLLLLLGAIPQTCKKCGDHGAIDCRRHSKAELSLEAGALFCSVVARCAECGGARRIACDNCSAQELAEREVDAQRARVGEWFRTREAIDAFMGRPLLHLESDHYRLLWEIPEMQVGRRRLDQHEAAHLYLGRLEDLHALFRKTFAAKPEEIPAKSDVFAWKERADHERASLKYAGQSGRGGVKLLGYRPVYSFFRDRNLLTDDEAVHRHVVHSVSHLLLSNAWNSYWVGNIKGGWVDEGVAHYFEDLLFGQCTNFCYEEIDTNRSFKGGKWRPPVFDMVAKGRLTSFAALARKNTTDLTTPEHAQSWSHCEYLIGIDGAKFAALVRILQDKRPSSDALREVYGMTLTQFEDAWRKHVLDTYPPR